MQSINYVQHQSALAAYTGPAAAGQVGGKPGLIGYEGNISGITNRTPLDHDLFYHPAFADAWDTWAQSVQDGTPGYQNSGLVLIAMFTLGGAWGNIIWSDYLYHGQLDGDGLSNVFTTAQAGGGDGLCHDISNVSVMGSRVRNWFGSANGSGSFRGLGQSTARPQCRPALSDRQVTLLYG